MKPQQKSSDTGGKKPVSATLAPKQTPHLSPLIELVLLWSELMSASSLPTREQLAELGRLEVEAEIEFEYRRTHPKWRLEHR